MNEEELRQEAEEYANKKYQRQKMPIRWNIIYTAYLAGAEPREKLIAELKSEKGCETCTKFDEVRLTKAKELLAKWVELYKPKLEGYPITPIQEQTEQFLKEE